MHLKNLERFTMTEKLIERLSISRNEIHVWCAFCDSVVDEQLLSRYLQVLSKEESLQYKRFLREKDQKQYLLTRALLRSVLSLYHSDLRPADWLFKRNSYGKPFIDNTLHKNDLSFNLSHTDNLVVLAVTLNHNIGIDAEHLLKTTNFLNTAKKVFTHHEYEQLQSLPPSERMRRFMDIWTLKEAYVKARGIGLSIPLHRFGYTISQTGNISILFSKDMDDTPAAWEFWQISPSDHHLISMAADFGCENTHCSVTIRQVIPFAEILEVNYPLSSGCVLLLQR